jgi:uncharacterized protein YjbI with pentapeptide repeats
LAVLTSVQLQAADLRGADFRNAQFEGADLARSIYNDDTQFPHGLDPDDYGAYQNSEQLLSIPA